MAAKGITVELDEDSLRRFLRTSDPERLIGDPLEDGIKELTLFAHTRATQGALEFADTKAGVRSLRFETSPLEGRVFTNSIHMAVREFGRIVPGPMPPSEALEGWARRKGILAGEKAKDVPGILFAIARAIARRRRPGRFFLKAAEEATQDRAPVVLQRVARDIERRWGAAS